TTGMAMFDYDLIAPLQATPGAAAARPRNCEDDPQTRLFERNNIRVVLSGIGGDEVMGGVPTPHPELQDLIAQGQFRRPAHQLKVWALNKRKPWFFLLGEAIGAFLPASLLPEPKYRRPVPWLTDAFVGQHRDVLSGFERRVSFFGSLPSFQMNMSAIETLRRQLGTKCLPKDPAHERRFPFLDRDLLEFIYAIPREQLVRPGYRRSLMRRALAGIVPAEVLERRRKAYASRGARVAAVRESNSLVPIIHNMASARLRIVNEQTFRKAVEAVKTSEEVPLVRF